MRGWKGGQDGRLGSLERVERLFELVGRGGDVAQHGGDRRTCSGHSQAHPARPASDRMEERPPCTTFHLLPPFHATINNLRAPSTCFLHPATSFEYIITPSICLQYAATSFDQIRPCSNCFPHTATSFDHNRLPSHCIPACSTAIPLLTFPTFCDC